MSLAYNTISFIIEIAWDIITEFATEILKSSKLEEELEEDKEREDVLRFVVTIKKSPLPWILSLLLTSMGLYCNQ